MVWYHYVSYFFGGLFFANAIPHWVSGVMGRPFQTPFATPRGEGLSTSTVNILWGGFNLLVAYLLLCHVGELDLRNLGQVGAAAVPAFFGSLLLARRFGRFNGGNDPR